MSSSYEKLQDQSPFIKHLKNYPVYVKTEKFLLSFSLITSLVEFSALYLLQFKALLNEYLPKLAEYGSKFEKFVVDEVLIKYLDVYLYFIKEDFKFSELTNNKYINSVKTFPGVQYLDKISTDFVSLVNTRIIITLGQLINKDIGKDYKPAESLARELYSTSLLLDTVANSTKNIILGYISTKSTPTFNGAAINVKDTAAKLSSTAAPPAVIVGANTNTVTSTSAASGAEPVGDSKFESGPNGNSN